MEPMTLGSAPSSPATPAASPTFLPNFLIGEPIQPNFRSTPNNNQQPQTPARRNPDSKQLSKSVFISQPQIIPSSPLLTPPKSGPPNQSLFDTLDSKCISISNNTTYYGDQSSLFFSKNVSGQNENVSNLNKSLNDYNKPYNSDTINTLWVTVFGFSPSFLGFVLTQLSTAGIIIDKKIPISGNWLHVKYSHTSDVVKALALNGKRINNCTMIGVMLHYDKENKENDSTIASPIKGARSLRHSCINLSTPNNVIQPENVPHKSTGFVSKAMEYVFGW